MYVYVHEYICLLHIYVVIENIPHLMSACLNLIMYICMSPWDVKCTASHMQTLFWFSYTLGCQMVVFVDGNIYGYDGDQIGICIYIYISTYIYIYMHLCTLWGFNVANWKITIEMAGTFEISFFCGPFSMAMFNN